MQSSRNLANLVAGVMMGITAAAVVAMGCTDDSECPSNVCYNSVCLVCFNGVCRLPSGSNCVLDTECATGQCVQYYESSSTRKCSKTAHCLKVYYDGGCHTCADGYYPTDDYFCAKIVPPGGPCTVDKQCTSNACSGGHCCILASNIRNCASCDGVNGTCTACKVGPTSNGTCALGANGDTCLLDSHCASSHCVPLYYDHSGKVCCGTSNCTQVYSDGKCYQCATFFYRTSGYSCLPKGTPGSNCSKDLQCQSGQCAGNHCCNSTDKNCDTCSAEDGKCLQFVGSLCTNNSDCVSNSCVPYHFNPLKSYCCKTANCTKTYSDGNCYKCASGFYQNGTYNCVPSPSTAPGGNCTYDGECQSGQCAGNHCCNSADKNYRCQTCSAKDGRCLLYMGSFCSNNSDCVSNSCVPYSSGLWSYCCNTTNCAYTDNSGICQHCADGFYRTAAYYCQPKGNPGNSCFGDRECLSGNCAGNYCCNSTGEDCDACSPEDGKCLQSVGRLCSNNSDCVSNSCVPYYSDPLKSYCCRAANCGETYSNGYCYKCKTGFYYINGTYCLFKRIPGSNCSKDMECHSGQCAGNYCCNSTDKNCDACSPQDGRCLQSVGSSCYNNSECVTNNCATYYSDPSRSYCCKTANCKKTHSDGDCYQCAPGFYLTGTGDCLPKISPGGSCSSNHQCQYHPCAGGHCCIFQENPCRCTSCSLKGSCTQCEEDFTLANGTCLQQEGGDCQRDSQCVLGQCIPAVTDSLQFVCSSTTNCTVAFSGSGICARCDPEHYLMNAECFPKRRAALSCSHDDQCTSSRCGSGHCCALEAAGHCKSCTSLNGSCTDCETMYRVSDGKCVPFLPLWAICLCVLVALIVLIVLVVCALYYYRRKNTAREASNTPGPEHVVGGSTSESLEDPPVLETVLLEVIMKTGDDGCFDVDLSVAKTDALSGSQIVEVTVDEKQELDELLPQWKEACKYLTSAERAVSALQSAYPGEPQITGVADILSQCRQLKRLLYDVTLNQFTYQLSPSAHPYADDEAHTTPASREPFRHDETKVNSPRSSVDIAAYLTELKRAKDEFQPVLLQLKERLDPVRKFNLKPYTRNRTILCGTGRDGSAVYARKFELSAASIVNERLREMTNTNSPFLFLQCDTDFLYIFTSQPHDENCEDVTATHRDSIQYIIDKSCCRDKLGKGREQREPASYNHLQVVKVEKVRNTVAWNTYQAKRNAMRNDPLYPEPEYYENTSTKAAKECCPNGNLYDIVNEGLFWHGTQAENVYKIAKSSFKKQFAERMALGKGIYFAQDCSKADQYSSPNEGGFFPLILARVCMGSVWHTREPNYNLVDPPRIPQSDLFYESVSGVVNRLGHVESVIYDNSQAYPAYIVWYRRTKVKSVPTHRSVPKVTNLF